MTKKLFMKNQNLNVHNQKTTVRNPPLERIVILGSGITGLCAGAILSKMGYQVKVLEAHNERFGGHARSIDIEGLRFSAGPQFVWNFLYSPNMVGERVLKFLDLDGQVEFVPLNPACHDRIFLDDDPGIDIPNGLDSFRDTMILNFPKEEDNLRLFFYYIKNLFEGLKLLHDQGIYLYGRREMMQVILSSSLKIKNKLIIFKLHNKTLNDVFNLCKLSRESRRIIYGNGGIFAENPENLSIGVYTGAIGYYHLGASFPKNGFYSLIQSLLGVIVECGGQVYLNKEIVKLNLTKEKIHNVECSDGSIHSCDYVISTLSPRLTCKLVRKCHPVAYRYKPSNSLVSCYLGLDNYPYLQQIALKNFWWQAYPEKVDYDSPDMTKKPTMLFISSETSNGVQYQDIHSSLQGITIFSPGNFDQAKEAFEGGSQVYEKQKSIISRNILFTLEKHIFPDVSRYVKFMKVLTPWDIYQELGAEAGNVYGRKLDVQSVLHEIKEIEGVGNLSIGCATVGQPGIATGFQTAVVLVEQITGEKV